MRSTLHCTVAWVVAGYGTFRPVMSQFCDIKTACSVAVNWSMILCHVALDGAQPSGRRIPRAA
jgi:hypothetical protein